MTKDEAIKIIQTEMECVSRPDCDRLACAYCDLAMRAEDILTAYQMAIEALQTDGDAVSRAEVLDIFKTGTVSVVVDGTMDTYDAVGEIVKQVKDFFAECVEELPSVHPEERTEERTETHACDCISRQAAVDAILEINTEHRVSWLDCAIDALDTLPSVQPERMKLVQQAVNTIMSTSRSYSIRDRAFRNAARLVQCAIDGEAPDFEQIPEGDEMPSEPKWIPCSKRLPEEAEARYWVCTDGGYQCQCRWTNDVFGLGEGDTWAWKIFDIPQYSKVIAWMSLPEPYSERRTDELD